MVGRHPDAAERDAHAAAADTTGGRRLWHAYRQGALVNVLNPKVALFFLAFLPQFVDPARGAAWAQILVLGAVFLVVGLVVDLAPSPRARSATGCAADRGRFAGSDTRAPPCTSGSERPRLWQALGATAPSLYWLRWTTRTAK